MSDLTSQSVPRTDVIDALRRLAARGATVQSLVEEIRTQLGHEEPLVLHVLWYFTHAFHISLRDALPLREWIGGNDDTEVNAVTLPAIERTRDRWIAELAPEYNGVAGAAVAEPGAVAGKHRS